MLIRLIYISHAADTLTPETADAILQTAHVRNTKNDITGVLCQGQGMFLQALEGERAKVTGLYARIFADPRHRNVELIHCESIEQRRYGQWSMAQVDLAELDPQQRIVWSEFDPYSRKGQAVMRRIDTLLAQATQPGRR
jgi:hypothetical protein